MTAHRHTDTLPLGSKPGKSDKRRGVQRFDPTTETRPRFSSLGTPRREPLPPVASATGGVHFTRPHRTCPRGRRTEHGSKPRAATGGQCPDAVGAPVARTLAADPGYEGPAQDASGPPPLVEEPPQDPTARANPREHSKGPMGADPDTLQRAPQVDTRGDMPPGASPMKVYPATVEAPDGATSEPGTPQSQPRAPASAHPSGMWFCPMPPCARSEVAFPKGWGCLQSLISQLRSVHLSAGSAPPDAWLRAHNLHVCLDCHELSAVGARCPGPRCSSAVLEALAAGKTAPPEQTRSPLSGAPPPQGLDII